MDFVFDLLDASATACYLSLAALLVYHLLNCWQQTIPAPVPAIATVEAAIDLPTALPAPTLTPAASIAPETTSIAEVASAPTAKRHRQASSAKGFSKRQPVTI